jgi:uncharacterized alpha-E superfamily protein
MLSRTAANLYWTSRYVERAEELARILDVAERLATLPSAYAGASNEWESAIATAAATDAFRAAYGEATRDNVVDFIVASPANPASICRCIEIARANARAVRTAITGEMWETINDAWFTLRAVKPGSLPPDELVRFLDQVKQFSLRFDGAAFRTMLRTDHYWFQRIGLYVERADAVARLLDVKYHVLLPHGERVGGGLDHFQWSALLRSASALTAFHWVYRRGIEPWLVAEFLTLRSEQPRSLISCYENLNRFLDMLAETYGRQGESQRLARAIYGRLRNARIDEVFQNGLHEFLTDFIRENNQLGATIARQYLF